MLKARRTSNGSRATKLESISASDVGLKPDGCRGLLAESARFADGNWRRAVKDFGARVNSGRATDAACSTSAMRKRVAGVVKNHQVSLPSPVVHPVRRQQVSLSSLSRTTTHGSARYF
jgi:hypothetical protein